MVRNVARQTRAWAAVLRAAAVWTSCFGCAGSPERAIRPSDDAGVRPDGSLGDGAPGDSAADAPPGEGDCFLWSGTGPIHDALETHDCVSVAPGTYPLTRTLVLRAGTILRGATGDREDASFVAAAGFDGGAMVSDDLQHGAVATVHSLSFDAAGRTQGVGARFMTFRNLEVKNAACWGVAVAGPSVTVEDSDIHHNGADPDCPAAPGGGVYVVNQEEGPGRYAPVFRDNSVHDNTGPGFDIAGVWDGLLRGNDIRDNTHWAGVSLFGSNWEIVDNDIYHPTANAPGIPNGQPYWVECRDGPNGVHPAAVMVCQRNDENNRVSTGNNIHGNRAASYYGVLLVGNDEAQPYWAPRGNRIANNNLAGSTHACADDFAPGQWGTDKNTWVNCTPEYF